MTAEVPTAWQPVVVQAADDPRIAQYKQLTDMDLRQKWETDGGYFMAEGALVIQRVVELGLPLVSVLTTPKWVSRLTGILGEWSGPVYLVTDDLAEGITGFAVHRGALAVVRRPPALTLEQLLQQGGHLLVLEDLVDHTNVGLAFRSARAMGMSGVLLSPRCADPLYRRAVKSSMGAVMSTPWARSLDWPADVSALAHHQLFTVALTPRQEAGEIFEVLATRTHDRAAVVIGSEGSGLSPQALEACAASARIRMHHGIDSLNAAAATAVACYALQMSDDIRRARHA